MTKIDMVKEMGLIMWEKISNNYGIRTALCLFVFSILTFGSISFVNALDVDVNKNVDFDESGVHVNRDCQSAPGASVLLDDSNDIAVKYLMVYPGDWNITTKVNIHICGMAAGQTWDTWSHEIYVNGNLAGAFNAHDWFSTTEFEWRTISITPFSFSLSNFPDGTLNIITIKDITNSPIIENLYLGIDTSVDFEKSAWNTNGNMDPVAWDCYGELSVYTEFQHLKYDMYNADTSYEDQVWIDDYNDTAVKHFNLTNVNFNDVVRGQIYIYGHGFGANYGHSSGPCSMFIMINDLIIFFNVEDVFRQNNQWCWGVIDFPVQGNLFNEEYNWVMIHDNNDNYESQNLAIGVDTDTDDELSSWQYSDGIWHGSLYQPYCCTGELMIGMKLFQSESPTGQSSNTFATSAVANYHYLPDLSASSSTWLRNTFLSKGWTCVQDKYNSSLYEGDFYLPGHANSADFIYHHGHGEQDTCKLFEYKPGSASQDNRGAPDDQILFGDYKFGSNSILESDYSSDGLDKEPEWIWYDACSDIKGNTPPSYDNNSDLQKLLYHGAHYLLGLCDDMEEPNVPYAATYYFTQFAFGCPSPVPVREAYELTVQYVTDYLLPMPGAYYYHAGNAGEYLWGVDPSPPSWYHINGEWTHDSFEHDDIIFWTWQD